MKRVLIFLLFVLVVGCGERGLDPNDPPGLYSEGDLPSDRIAAEAAAKQAADSTD